MLKLEPEDVVRHRLSTKRAVRAVAVSASVVLLCVWCSDAEAPSTREPYPEVECPAVVDVRQDGTFTGQAGRKVPAKPEDWQQTKPCRSENDEVEVAGACYLPLERKPPCKSSQYEWQGRCLAAVAKQRRPNSSIGRNQGE